MFSKRFKHDLVTLLVGTRVRLSVPKPVPFLLDYMVLLGYIVGPLVRGNPRKLRQVFDFKGKRGFGCFPLITRRSEVQILPPLPRKYTAALMAVGWF